MTLRAVPLLPEHTCVKRDTSLLDVLRLMLDQGINHLPVCDSGNWAGLIDINDILGELLPVGARGERGLPDLRFVGDGVPLIASRLRQLAKKTVRDVRLLDLPTLDEDTPLLEAAQLLHRHGKPLPVLGADGAFRGMLSRRVLLAHLLAKAAD